MVAIYPSKPPSGEGGGWQMPDGGRANVSKIR